MAKKYIWIVFGLGLILRLFLIPNPGFEADISFWKSWGLATLDHGIVEGLKVSNFNYPIPFAYTLGFLAWLYSLFADPHNFNEFWTNTNTLFLFVAKLPAILADFGIAVILLRYSKKLGPFLAAAYLLNPIALIDGAWWGQVDSLGVFTFLLALLALLKRLPFLAGVLYMLAMMTKLQNMIYGPLFFLFLYQISGRAGLIRAVAGATVAFFGLNIEFLLAKNMGRVVASLVENYDYFPYMSLNAFNLWWIVAAGRGMEVSDKLLAIGLANAKTVGLLLFSSFYLFAILQQLIVTLLNGQIVKKQQFSNNNNLTIEKELYKKNVLRNFLISLIIVNAAFFLFQSQSHDRYAFPLSVFLLLLAPSYEATKLLSFLFFYLLYTLFYFYNLHTALVFNYPNNGLPLLSLLTQTPVTIFASLILLVLFAIFVVYTARATRPIIWIIPIAVFLFAIIGKNMPLITKKPVSLTSFVPYAHSQGFGQYQIDMPVNATFGWRSQSFLSVQYAFYRKGFGTHSPSRMDFDIGGTFKRFTTDVGIDTEAGPQGTAVFEIYGDNQLLYSSGAVVRFEFPRHADIDVSGVKILTLVTTDAGDGNTDDHTDWLNPILYP